MTGGMVLSLALAVLIGVTLGALGGGGSVLTLPIFVFVAGIPAQEAVAMSMVVVGGTSLFGAVLHWRNGNFHAKAALLFAATGVAGAFGGSFLTHMVSQRVLLGIFAVLMLVTGIAMIRKRVEKSDERRCRIWPCLMIGATVGVLTGFLGVGGGFLIVPALVLFAGIETKAAVGSSLAIIALNSVGGSGRAVAAGVARLAADVRLPGTGARRHDRRLVRGRESSRRGTFQSLWLVRRRAGARDRRLGGGRSSHHSPYLTGERHAASPAIHPRPRHRFLHRRRRKERRSRRHRPDQGRGSVHPVRQGPRPAHQAHHRNPRPRRLRVRVTRTEGEAQRRRHDSLLRPTAAKDWTQPYADQHVKEGDTVEFGSVRLGFQHTPGHTPEHISVLLFDKSRSAETPWVMFTGDFLFVGDVGRPDLLGEEAKKELAHELYQSVFERITSLPDITEIFPAHGAGSLCGKAIGSRRSSTLGFERLYNGALKKKPEEQWVHDLLEGHAALAAVLQTHEEGQQGRPGHHRAGTSRHEALEGERTFTSGSVTSA